MLLSGIHSVMGWPAIMATILGFMVAVPCWAFYKLVLEGIAPTDIPWAGTGSIGVLARVRSGVPCMFRVRRTLLAEYNKSRPFLLSSFLNGPMLVLPREQVSWYKVQLANRTLDMGLALREKYKLAYGAINTDISAHGSRFENLTHRILTRKEVKWLPGAMDEMRMQLRTQLANKRCDWQSVSCADLTFNTVLAGLHNVLVGVPRCRDQEYLKAPRAVVQFMLWTAIAVQLMPGILRPVVGAILHRQAKSLWKPIVRKTRPLFKQLLDTTDGLDGRAATATIMSRYAEDAGRIRDGSEILNETTLQTLLYVSSAASDNTALSCLDSLQRILSHPRSEELVDNIRREAEQLFAGELTPEALDSMSVTDSICRESLRLGVSDLFFATAMVTVQTATPDGIVLPRGSRVAVPVWGLHCDATMVPGEEPGIFDPYRYCKGSARKQKLSHEISDSHLMFSLGSHACPGRWLVAAIMKIFLALLLLEYDVEPLVGKPKALHVGGHRMPSMSTMIRVRPREHDKSA